MPFVWDDGRGSNLPIRFEEEIRALKSCYFLPGARLIARWCLKREMTSRGSYHLIFSPSVKKHILPLKPKEISDGGYDISWRDNGLHSLNFRWLEGIGYKFSAEYGGANDRGNV